MIRFNSEADHSDERVQRDQRQADQGVWDNGGQIQWNLVNMEISL